MPYKKHFSLSLLLFILILTICIVSSCRSSAASVGLSPLENAEANMNTGSIIDPNSEIRGVWIASVYNIDYPSAAGLDAAALQAELDAILDTCEQNGLNTIFFQVRPACDALYNSAIFPISSYLSTDGKLVFDPLEYLVTEAHKRNIFVHAWVNPLRVTMGTHDLTTLPENSPARQNPDWTVPYADGKLYLNAGIPQVRQLIVDGVREIVAGYDVDGIVFDDYFYPYPTNNADGTPALFDDGDTFAMYGGEFTDLADWRRNNINTLIQSVYETVHTTDPDCLFGVSPFGIWQNDDGKNGGSATNGLEAYDALYCDALAWVEGGYVDYLSPQLYWQFSNTAAPYDVMVRWWNTVLDNTGVDLYVSHAVYRYEDGNWSNPQGEMAEQVSFARSEISYKGSIFYGYDEIRQNTNGAADDLARVFADDIIYSRIQSNGRTVEVTTPANGSTMTSDTSYIIGTSDPAFPLYMNGEKIGRTRSGYFSLMVTLQPGENKFTFQHKGEEYVYTLYYRSANSSAQPSSGTGETILSSLQVTGIYPSSQITTSNTKQWISCVAPYGSKVTATLGGASAALTMLEAPEITWTSQGYIGVIYGGNISLPAPSSTDLLDAGQVTLTVTHPDGTLSAKTASIRVMGPDAKLAVKVKERYAELKFTETSSYYNDYTVQSPGMTDYVVAQKNGFYQLRMGGYIAEKWVDETTDYPGNSTKISSAVLTDTGTCTELRLHTVDNPAYYGVSEEGKFVVTLYAVDAETAVDVRIEDNPLFSACDIIRIPEKDRVRYALTLKDERNFYGFDLYYDGDYTVVTFRNPQIVDLNREKPLEGVHIVLDAGHGGTDSGARGANTTDAGLLDEKDINLAITLETEKRLLELGAQVALIRQEDVTVSLNDRMDYLEDAEPDLSVSIHQNSMGYTADITRIRGVLPLYCSDSGKLLADTVGSGVSARTGRMLRNSQYQMLALCRNPKFPQALIEVGFITCVEEYEQMAGGSGITQAAQGVVDGILEYFRRQAEYASM